MAAEFVGGVVLSPFLQVTFDRLASQFRDLFPAGKQNEAIAVRMLNLLKGKLRSIDAVADDAEVKQFRDRRVRAWLLEVKDVVFEVEDLLDEIVYELSQCKVEPESQTIANRMWNFFKSSRAVSFDKEIESRMKQVLEELEFLSSQKDYLGLKEASGVGVGSGSGSKMSLKLPSTSLVSESVIYGRDDDKEIILNWLTSDTDNCNRLSILSIVGMGGVGKTTLAQHVYNDPTIEGKFDIKVWVYVSDEFDVYEVTRSILDAITYSTDKSSGLKMIRRRLIEQLKGKRFLLVLDDVWIENRNMWEEVLTPLIYGAQGSRIVVTTRSQKVASIMQSKVYNLELLQADCCWQVFVKHAFRDDNPCINAELKEISIKIVEKCKGFPLSLKMIGSLLDTKSSLSEWQSVLITNVWDSLDEYGEIISPLLLSYHHLPSHLKRCFAYCALFPNGYEFDKELLILLWMAENFLQCPQQNKSPEEVGEQYFNDLLSRSFFQQSSRDGSCFVMHDLLHDLAKYVMGDICFSLEVDRAKIIPKRTRHLSFVINHAQYFDGFGKLHDAKRLRTFIPTSGRKKFLYDRWYCKILIHELFSKFKFLHVLSLSGCLVLTEVPDSIGNLKHLRSLDLSNTDIKKLPDSTCSLYNLQILKLNQCRYLEELPSNLHKLTNLRHLEFIHTKVRKMPVHFGELKNLQVLRPFLVGRSSEFNIPQLEKLGLLGAISIGEMPSIVNPLDMLGAYLYLKMKTHLLEQFVSPIVLHLEQYAGLKIMPKSLDNMTWQGLLSLAEKPTSLDNMTCQGLLPPAENDNMALPKLPPYCLELTGRVYGRQKEKDQVVEFLQDLSDSDDDNTNTYTNMSMLGIVGQGGIGKTTLAHIVYEDHKVRTWFELTVWVTFPSYQLDAGTLAMVILRILEVSFDQDDQLLDLMPRLQKSLSGRRLLLVFDGCWSVHEWEILRTCFESAARGSAIILTTGTTEAALQMLADHVLHLSFLSMEHCWSLFSEHCFGNQSLSCSPQLETMGKRILNKCGGVPLAAKMLGGLLHKKEYKVWEEIWRSQQWDSTNVDLPTPFVRLCYLDLPAQLKRCITYLAMFPKGYKFQKRQVVPLWMAKSLIQQGNTEIMEEIGNEYFDFLVARSFLIRSHSGGNMDFTMHDMVHHDLALFECKKFHSNFDGSGESIDTSCLISNEQNVEETSSDVGIAGITHGLQQQSPKIEVNIPTTTNDTVQNTFESGSHFETLKILDASQLVKLPSTLHSLRIEGCHYLESLQDVLMNRSTNLFELFIIDCCSLTYVTDGWYPISLRTLYVHKCRKLEFLLPLEIMQNFEFLEHLFIGSSCDSLKSFPVNLFPKLKILCIWDCPNLESLSMEECQNSNLSLKSLEIRDCSNLVSFPTKGLLSPNLRSLSVSNCKKLRSLPNYMTTLTSLQSVFVVKCPELESVPAGGLPSSLKLLSIAFCDKLIPQKEWNLQMLHCLHRFEIESGCVGMKSFPEKDLFPINLNSLYISKLPSLEVLDHNGLQQLTALESLEINCCKKLYSLPEVLPSSLTFLCIKESSMLSQRLLNQASADWLKIAHICNIQIDDNVISRNSTGASFSSRNRIPVSSNTKRTSYHKATVSKFNIKNMPGAL